MDSGTFYGDFVVKLLSKITLEIVWRFCIKLPGNLYYNFAIKSP